MSDNSRQQAFITTSVHATFKRHFPSICSQHSRPRRTATRWRCVAQDEPTEKSQPIVAQENVKERVEGVVSLDSVNLDLEDALSRKWETLDFFEDKTAKSKSKQSHLVTGIEHAEGSKKKGEQNNETDANTQIEAAEVDSSGTKPAKSTRKKKRKTKEQKQEEIAAEQEEEHTSEPNWYFVQVKPGHERSTSISIRNMSESLQSLHVLDVLVPTTKIMRLSKGGKSVKKEERFFPGYVLVLMAMNRYNYSNILRIPNIQWFMNDPNRDKKQGQPFRTPLPVTDGEMKAVFQKIRQAESGKPEFKTSMRPGDYIEVTSGLYVGNTGRIAEVKPDLYIVKVNLNMYGRTNSVELEIQQVKIIDKPEEEPEVDDPESQNETPSESSDGEKKKSEAVEAGVATSEDDLELISGETKASADTAEDSGFTTATTLDGEDEKATKLSASRSRGERKSEKTEAGKALGTPLAETEDADDGFVSSGEELDMFLNDEDEPDLWELDETEKQTPTMFDDTDDGFEPHTDLKFGASSLLDEAEHPFNEPDDGFTEVRKVRHARKKAKATPSPANAEFRGSKKDKYSGTDADFFEEPSFQDSDLDEDETAEQIDDKLLVDENQIDAEFESIMKSKGKRKNTSFYPSLKTFNPSKIESAEDKYNKTTAKHGCADLPDRMVPLYEEHELTPVDPEDKHRIAGAAIAQDLFAELRRCEKEGDRRYERPPPGYDMSIPIISFEGEENVVKIDITKDLAPETLIEEYDYPAERKRYQMARRAKKKNKKRSED